MARYFEPSAEQVQIWRTWLAERPAVVRVVAERFDPWSLYRYKQTGQRVTLVSFEDGDPVTLTVCVSGEFNATLFDREVFGVLPQDLEPCELPAGDEALGSILSDSEVEENLDTLRAGIRPDLWALDSSGKANRKQ